MQSRGVASDTVERSDCTASRRKRGRSSGGEDKKLGDADSIRWGIWITALAKGELPRTAHEEIDTDIIARRIRDGCTVGVEIGGDRACSEIRAECICDERGNYLTHVEVDRLLIDGIHAVISFVFPEAGIGWPGRALENLPGLVLCGFRSSHGEALSQFKGGDERG
jgi:hypothetical protein